MFEDQAGDDISDELRDIRTEKEFPSWLRKYVNIISWLDLYVDLLLMAQSLKNVYYAILFRFWSILMTRESRDYLTYLQIR